MARQRAEVQAVRQSLAVAQGNLSRAAELLGVSRPTLYDLLGKYGIDAAQFGRQVPAAGNAVQRNRTRPPNPQAMTRLLPRMSNSVAEPSLRERGDLPAVRVGQQLPARVFSFAAGDSYTSCFNAALRGLGIKVLGLYPNTTPRELAPSVCTLRRKTSSTSS